jgi:cytochrome c553
MPFRLPIRQSIVAATIALVLGQATAFAAPPNPKVGAQISAQCAACHGSDGLSVDNSIPNLAGQHYVYLVQELNAFKNRDRNSPLMNELTRTLTQQQIEDIAAYYAGQQIEVRKPSKSKP